MVPSWFDAVYQRSGKQIGKKLSPGQMRFFLGAVVLLLVCGFFATQAFRPPVLWAVKLDGKTVGWVEDRTEFTDAFSRLQQTEITTLGAGAQLASEIEFIEESGQGLEPSDPVELAQELATLVAYTVPAAQINVDGKAVVTLASEEAAHRVLEMLTKSYCPEQEGTTLAEVKIRQQAEVVATCAGIDELKNEEEALRILMRGTDEVITHQVAQGESLWSIARNYDLRVDDLRQANPQLKSDVLQIGQELDLVVPKPYLTVETREIVTHEQTIPFSTKTIKDDSLYIWERQIREQGKAGSKEVTWEIVKENGQEKERELLQDTELTAPVTQVVAIGTKMPEAQGTGEFSWPMSRGTITSRYGSRGGRLHAGVDIAASTGTPIYAADSGVVTMAQWYSGYGKIVVIEHGNGKSTLYGHCSEILVRLGSKVEKGQLIARVGSTGRSTGSHLHFEVRENGRARDPLSYFQQ